MIFKHLFNIILGVAIVLKIHSVYQISFNNHIPSWNNLVADKLLIIIILSLILYFNLSDRKVKGDE
jgi:hypothetical protein